MNTDLCFILTMIWLFVTDVIEMLFYYIYFEKGNLVTLKSVFTLTFSKKHLILNISLYSILVIIWAAIGAFSNLNAVVDGVPLYQTRLELLSVYIVSETLTVMVSLVQLVRMQSSL